MRYNAVDTTPTEGFSSLAHVLLVALGDRLGIDPLAATRGLSLLAFLLIPLTIGLALSALLEVQVLAALTVSFTGQILFFLTEATPFNLRLGMETIIFMGGLAWLAGWSLRELGPGRVTAGIGRILSGCLAVTLVALSRPEGSFLVIMMLAIIFLTRRFLLPETKAWNNRPFFIVATWVVIGLAGYALWKKRYFGYFLPNPYYVKSHNAIMGMKIAMFPGWEETRLFLLLVLPWLGAGVPLFFLVKRWREQRRALLAAAFPGALMALAYAKAIHEAAYFYRYEFPFLVHLHLLLVGLVCLLARRMRALPLLLVPAAIAWVTFFGIDKDILRVKPLAWLDVRVKIYRTVMEAIGRDLGMTRLGQRATIAVTAAGAIPFYSGFRALDLLGLNDNYLSGREPHTLAEVWDYIDSFKPDVFQSSLPPATPGIPPSQPDPVMDAPAVMRAVGVMSGTSLTHYWDEKKFLEMLRRETIYLRDHYTFGGACRYEDAWVILYLRKDSPFRDRIRNTLKNYSDATDWATDLRPFFRNDPRGL